MSKRPRSPGLSEDIHITKRQHTTHGAPRRHLSFESALADELVLVIFGYLDYLDLCRAEMVCRSWQRLSVDNELWKYLFHYDFGISRLRGARYYGLLGRPIKPLRGHAAKEGPQPLTSQWKELYRIGRNWQTGRGVTHHSSLLLAGESRAVPLVVLIGRGSLITSNGILESSPIVNVSLENTGMILQSSKTATLRPIRASSISLNQAISTDGSITVAVFYSTEKKFHHLSVFNANLSNKSSRELHIVTPSTFRGPIAHSAYHSSLLIALSSTFQVDIYHVSDSAKPALVRTMSSFTSFPPSSLTVCRPSSTSHKVLLSYAVPIYPSYWSVATTELQVDDDTDVTNTRTLRAFQSGWETIEESGGLPRLGGSKMPGIMSVQSDGRYLVTAPRNENYMELYRLRQTALVFVRILFGPSQKICALAVADARCISISLGGVLWVHDLDQGWGVEVQERIEDVDEENTRIYFDDRRIVVTTPAYLRTISFD